VRCHPVCRTSLGRAVALGIAVCVAAPAAVTPNTALAVGPGKKAKAKSAAQPGKDLNEARRLYDDGKSFFETSQFAKAADIWTRAYGKVPDDAPGVKNAMVYNIATAQEKAYAMDRDVVRLHQAEQLLRTWVDVYKKMYKKTPETKAEVDKANARIRELQEKIKQAESGVEPEPVVVAEPADPGTPTDARYGSGAVDGIVWNTGSTAEVDKEALAENQKLAAESKKADNLIIAGYVVGAVGILALFVAAGGFGTSAAADPIDDEDLDPDAAPGEAAASVGYGGIAFGVAGLAAGATLLGVGFSRRKKIRARQVRVAPMFGPKTAGVALGMKF